MMTYKKPEIAKSAAALEAIQGMTSKSVTPEDNVCGSQIQTPSAYEADE
ncbi:MAG TPA: hypothetical protein VK788_13065 [Terriglobales bacterium]|jgi:hypothetical protein|nr:hypothetical protein [Terriglobales bacterium]